MTTGAPLFTAHQCPPGLRLKERKARVARQRPVKPAGHGWERAAVVIPFQPQLELEGCGWRVTDSHGWGCLPLQAPRPAP